MLRTLVTLLISLINFFWTAPPLQQGALAQEDTYHTIYIVRHSWHAGIVLQVPDFRTLPVAGDYPGSNYLEIGWGDADYYRSTDPGFWITFKAAILPTMSTLHVVGFRQDVPDYFPGSDILTLKIAREHFPAFLEFLREAFAVNGQDQLIRLGKGLYGRSSFYKGSEHYYAFRNCNTWVARALRKAGIPLRPAGNLTVNRLMSHLKEHGTVIRESN